jgi:hypothetical protein
MEYGVKGYGLYFYCLEVIAGTVEASNVTFELEPDAEILARRLSMDTLEVERIMHRCIELGLFEMADNGRLTCLKLKKYLEAASTSNPEMRKIISKSHDDVMTTSPNRQESSPNYQGLPDQIRLDKIRLDKNREDIHEPDAIKLIKTIHRQHSSEAHWDDEQYKANTNWPLAMKRVKERLADGCDLEWFRWYLLAASRDKFCRDDLRFSLNKLLAPKMLDRLAIEAQSLRDADAEEKTAAERESEEFTARLNALRAEAAREKE